MGPPSDFLRAGLGECDTPLEPWGRWLPEYAKKMRSRPGSWRARARDAIFGLLDAIFGLLGPFGGGFPGWVGAIDLGGDVSLLGQPEYGKKIWSRTQPRGLRAPKPPKMTVFVFPDDFPHHILGKFRPKQKISSFEIIKGGGESHCLSEFILPDLLVMRLPPHEFLLLSLGI